MIYMKPARKLGRVQLQIMEVLWHCETATAREITDAMNRKNSIAHSTVQTLLRKLEDKGAVTHEVRERTFVFRALWQQNETKAAATRDLLTRVFNGSASGLVAHLLQHEKITPSEMKRLRELIENAPQKNSPPKKGDSK